MQIESFKKYLEITEIPKEKKEEIKNIYDSMLDTVKESLAGDYELSKKERSDNVCREIERIADIFYKDHDLLPEKNN